MTFSLPDSLQILGNFGFPILLSIYLLIRFEVKIDKLSESINKLTDIIDK